jgi:hypothetical protein
MTVMAVQMAALASMITFATPSIETCQVVQLLSARFAHSVSAFVNRSEPIVALMAPSRCATHALSRFHRSEFAQWQKARVEKLDVADVLGDADRLNGRRQDRFVSIGRLDHAPVRDSEFSSLTKFFTWPKKQNDCRSTARDGRTSRITQSTLGPLTRPTKTVVAAQNVRADEYHRFRHSRYRNFPSDTTP